MYDAAHLGHARNYLAFDIVRRVLEDYFGYQILYVMNITDIEDKIILRARRNHIMAEYLAGDGADVGRLLADATAALGDEVAKRKHSLDEADAEVQRSQNDGGNEKILASLREAADSERLLFDKADKAFAALNELATEATKTSTSVSSEKILELSRDALAAALDRERKASVTDQEIFRAHAAKWEKEFMSDMEQLGVRPPTVLTRVSEYVPEIVTYIETIVANGLGYEANGSVYFDTQAFTKAGHKYGKLNPWAVGSALSEDATSANANDGDGVAGEKRHRCDFALWKAAKPGEPTWDSPWGKGRPGWHIECSAMASAIIGQTVDIHSGGEDLRFPHHDNELAQAEAFYHCEGCQQWVNYFLHSGHLGIEGLKMSKSLKNFVTIKESLEVFTPRQLRLMMALNPWDRRMAYGPQLQEEVKTKEAQLKNFFANVDVALRKFEGKDHPEKWHAEELALSDACRTAAAAVEAGFLDSVDTRAALNACFDLIKTTNIYLSSKQAAGGVAQPMLLRQVAALVSRTLSVMGLTPFTFDRIGMDDMGASSGEDGKLINVLDALSQFRDSVRMHAKSGAPSKSFLECCDCFRDEALIDCGVRLEDTPDGSVWKLDDPEVLRREKEEKQASSLAAARKKIVSKAESLKKEIVKFATLQEMPSVEESLAAKYSKFGEDGYPTHDADGNELEGKAIEKGKKDVEKARKARLPLQKKVAELGPNFLDGMKGMLHKMEQELKDMTVG